MPQLGGLDSCVAPSIILAQRVKEPLHLPFDFRCIGVHAALPPVSLRAEGLITYFGRTGKLFPARSLKPRSDSRTTLLTYISQPSFFHRETCTIKSAMSGSMHYVTWRSTILTSLIHTCFSMRLGSRSRME